MIITKNFSYLGLVVVIFSLLVSVMNGQSKPAQRPPSLPTNIPPPPNFSGGLSKNGKFQIISTEYYSQDAKPFLYKRVLKLDTSTGDVWVLHSVTTSKGEMRTWVPFEYTP
jgi:hypothetical protein